MANINMRLKYVFAQKERFFNKKWEVENESYWMENIFYKIGTYFQDNFQKYIYYVWNTIQVQTIIIIQKIVYKTLS